MTTIQNCACQTRIDFEYPEERRRRIPCPLPSSSGGNMLKARPANDDSGVERKRKPSRICMHHCAGMTITRGLRGVSFRHTVAVRQGSWRRGCRLSAAVAHFLSAALFESCSCLFVLWRNASSGLQMLLGVQSKNLSVLPIFAVTAHQPDIVRHL